MSTPSAEIQTYRPWSLSQPQVQLLRATLLATAALLLALAAWLVARRAAGAFQASLSDIERMVLAATSVVAFTALRIGAMRVGSAPVGADGFLAGAVNSLCTGAVVLLGIAVSDTESPNWAVATFWTTMAAGELAGWTLLFRQHFRNRIPSNTNPAALGEELPALDIRRDMAQAGLSLPETALHDDECERLPTEVSQRLTRARGENGEDIVYGMFRCQFSSGQRQQNIHVAFCPPLNCVPRLSVDQVDGPTANVRATQIQTYGACIEVRLRAASTRPADVQIQLFASESHADETWG